MQLEEKKKPINTHTTPLVSIITPLYNAAPFIAQTIASIQAQTYTHWELHIVDDNSIDNSVVIVEKLARLDPRIKLTKTTTNKGAAYCRNKATTLATGTFIAFLDADDLWHPHKLETQIKAMQDTNNPVSYTSYVHINEQGNELGIRINALPFLPYSKQLKNNYVGNLTGVYNASSIGKISAPNIRKRQDWAVWLKAIELSNKPALGIQKDLAYYRIHKNSISANKWKLIAYNYQFYHQFLKFSKVKAFVYLLQFFKEYFTARKTLIQQYTP